MKYILCSLPKSLELKGSFCCLLWISVFQCFVICLLDFILSSYTNFYPLLELFYFVGPSNVNSISNYASCASLNVFVFYFTDTVLVLAYVKK